MRFTLTGSTMTFNNQHHLDLTLEGVAKKGEEKRENDQNMVLRKNNAKNMSMVWQMTKT